MIPVIFNDKEATVGALAGQTTIPHHGVGELFNWLEARIDEANVHTA